MPNFSFRVLYAYVTKCTTYLEIDHHCHSLLRDGIGGKLPSSISVIMAACVVPGPGGARMIFAALRTALLWCTRSYMAATPGGTVMPMSLRACLTIARLLARVCAVGEGGHSQSDCGCSSIEPCRAPRVFRRRMFVSCMRAAEEEFYEVDFPLTNPETHNIGT